MAWRNTTRSPFTHHKPNTPAHFHPRFGAGKGRFPLLLEKNHARNVDCTRYYLNEKTVLGRLLLQQ